VPGSASSVVFEDVSGVADIIKTIREHPSRAVDNYVLDVGIKEPNIHTALVFPPIIYGLGDGPVNQRSIQIPDLARLTLEKGHGVRIGQGLSRWGNVHIRDLGRLFSALVGAKSLSEAGSKLWNEDGLYLTGVGEVVSISNRNDSRFLVITSDTSRRSEKFQQ
jgi:nucleoside-diphosphate-sugar epimerase